MDCSFLIAYVWIASSYHELSDGYMCCHEVVDVFIDLKRDTLCFGLQNLIIYFSRLIYVCDSFGDKVIRCWSVFRDNEQAQNFVRYATENR